MNSIDEEASKVGICKVIPPKNWFRAPDYNDYVNSSNLKFTPIQQQAIMNPQHRGAFAVKIDEFSSMELKDFKPIADAYTLEENGSKRGEFDKYKQLEEAFWKGLGSVSDTRYEGMEKPLYGADLPGTLFGEDCHHSWNLSNLDSTLRLLGYAIPGVTSSMLYVGMWRSMFAFHTEDYDLYSINYLHTGAPKCWYSVPPSNRSQFESYAKFAFAEDCKDCEQFLRHKNSMISPKTMKDKGINFNTVVQEPGEFVITFPGTYHGGYNQGFNIAEATNFATPRWFDIGRKAKSCSCRKDVVTIDVDLFETLYLRQANYCSQSPFSQNYQRMRCPCKKNATYDKQKGKWNGLTKNKNGKTEKIFRCYACHLWCHHDCIYDPDDEEKGSSDDSDDSSDDGINFNGDKKAVIYEDGEEIDGEQERLLCETCYEIENNTASESENDNSDHDSGDPRALKMIVARKKSAASGKGASGKATSPIRSQSIKSRYKTPKIGDIVITDDNDSEGEVNDILDTDIKIMYMKNKKRSYAWTSLGSISIVSRPSAEKNASNAKKDSSVANKKDSGTSPKKMRVQAPSSTSNSKKKSTTKSAATNKKGSPSSNKHAGFDD